MKNFFSKSKIRKLVASLLCAVLLLGVLPLNGISQIDFKGLHLPEINLPDFSSLFSTKASAETSGTCGENLTWTLDDEGTLTISGTGEMEDYDYGKVSAPWNSYRSETKSLCVENGVTSIGNRAFYNFTGLTSISISDSVISIGERAFDNCTGLTSITIPDSVSIIGPGSFYSCTGLTNVNFGNGVTVIGGHAFIECTGLTSINIPDSVTCIGSEAFSTCSGLTKITIGQGVTDIEDLAFYRCTGLTSVTIPDSVKSIGGETFSYCAGLTSVVIGSGVINIGTNAFLHCTSISSVIVNEDNTQYHSFGNCLINTESETIILGCKNSIIPDDGSVTSIGSSAFYECADLKSITIPDSVTNIGGSAFYNCTGLTSIIIPDSVTSIGSWAFYECTGLTSIIIPDSVTSIGDAAFYGCTGLTSATISNSVTRIDTSVFYGCTGLTNVTIGNSVTTIGYEAFHSCTGLTEITIPDSVTFIGDYAFENCTGLTSITIPDSVTFIDQYAFYNCTGLTSITIPNSVTSIGYRAFYGCAGLTSITIGNSVTNIGNSAFENCTGLTSVTIGNSVTSIGNNAFANCTGLTSITIPDSVTSIGGYAFNECTGLASVTIGNSVISIGVGAFRNCTGLTSVTIGKHVKTIGSLAFSGCTGVDNINIPSSVLNIGENAFFNVNSITYDDDRMHATGAPWGALNTEYYREGSFIYYDTSKEVLIACDSDKKDIKVPETVVQVEDYAFAACKNAETIEFKSDEIVFTPDSLKGCETLKEIKSANTDDGITYTYEKPKNTKLSAPKDNEEVELTEDNGILFCNRNKSGTYTVPDNIRYICSRAFANCMECFVTIPDKVDLLYIGENAFLNNKNHIEWNKKGLFTIGAYIISAGSNIDNVTVPKTIKLIADGAFENCRKLKSVTVEGNTLTAIGDYAFAECINLKTVNLPDSLRSIGIRAFHGTKIYSAISDEPKYINNKYLVYVPYSLSGDFVVKNGTKCIADGVFAGCINITSVTLPKEITEIGEKTFYGCINLESVDIPDEVTVIDKSAFRGCSALEQINIPESVRRLDDQAFYGCYALQEIDVKEKNEAYKSVDGVLFNNDGTVLIQYPAGKEIDKYEIGSNVKLINSFAFRKCENVNVVLIPDDVKLGLKNPFEKCNAVYMRYGDGNFYNDYTLYSDKNKTTIVSVSNRFEGEYTVADEVESIADNAFAGNEKITGIVFNEKLESVGASAFEDCTSLSKITFAKTNGGINDVVKVIGDKAFCNCAENKTENSDILKNAKIGKFAFHNHKYKDEEEGWNIIIPSDCVDAGKKERTCTEPGCEHIDEEIIQPTGHNFRVYVSNGDGTKTAKCENENCTITDTVNEEMPIDPVEPAPTEPTPTDPTPTEPEPAHEHSYKEEVTTKPTCTEDGVMTCTCECGESYTKAIAKTGHTPGEWTVVTAATTEAAGKEVRKCTVCGETIEEREITKLEPDESKIRVSAPSGTRTDVKYNQPAKIIASATGLPKNYKLAIYEGDSQKKAATANDAGEATVELDIGEVKTDRTFTVKVLDASGNEVDGKSKTVTIDIDDGFFAKIISFFLKLFGALKQVDIKQ